MTFVLLLAAAIGPAGQSPADDGLAREVGAKLQRPAYDPTRTTKAIAFWKSRTDRDPAGGQGWAHLASAYLARHHETGAIVEAIEAEKAARKALTLGPNPSIMIVLGRALLSQHRFPDALEVAEKAAQLDPNANRLLCDVQIELGEMEKARVAASRIPIDTDPLDRVALEARLLEAESNDEVLIARLTELRDMADALPQLPHELASWYRVRLGHALIDRGRLSEGRACCRAALAIVPKDARALVGLAEAEAAEGNWASALDFARQAHEAAPTDFEALEMIAVTNRRLGKTEESDRAFEKLRALVESAPRIYDRHYARSCAENDRDLEEGLSRAEADLGLRKDPMAYDTLAMVLSKLGKPNEAKEAIDLAVKADPNHPEIRKHAEQLAIGGSIQP